MKISYTDEQLEAIFLRDKSILVSAAAGSGKTRVLVDRIVYILLYERASLKNMLVVTFTNAAASEMRNRLRKKVEELIGELRENGNRALPFKSPYSPEENISHLLKEMENISRADISTMHSYCSNLLREYFYEEDLDPNFKIGRESSLAIYRNEALEESLEELLDCGDEDFKDWAIAYENKSGTSLIRTLSNFHFFISSQLDPQAFIEEERKELKREVYDFKTSKLYSALVTYIEEKLDTIGAEMNYALSLSLSPGGPLAYEENIRDDLNILEDLGKSIKDPDSFYEKMTSLSFSRLKTVKKKDKDLIDPEIQEEVKALRDDYKGEISDLKGLAFKGDRLGEDASYNLRDFDQLVKFYRLFVKKYGDKKREREVLDFDDLEHKTLDLLKKDGVRESIKKDLDYIFFDEYQDSSKIQEGIIERLKKGDNLFFVGDVKQSIYRFRLADPSLFNKRADLYKKDGNSEVLYLSKNFRSREEILDFCNFFFENAMTKELGQIDYRGEGQKLVPGKYGEKDPDSINISLIDRGGEGVKPLEIDPQALYVADQIKSLTRDLEAGPSYKYRDICVLIRSPRAHMDSFEMAFKNAGIPYYFDLAASSLKSLEVEVFIDILKVVNNDREDKPLLAFLLSLGAFDENDLAQIRADGEEEIPFYEAFRKKKGEDSPLGKRVDEFFEKLGEIRSYSGDHSLEELANYIYTESGLQKYLLSLSSGKDREENIRAFIDLIKDYEIDGRGGLTGFLSYVDWLLEKATSDTNPSGDLPQESDRVRFMSIHKSKGLEFKVVFLCHTEKRFNTRDQREDILYDDDLGLGFSHADLKTKTKQASLSKLLIQKKKSKEDKSEEMRLLYVAMTRAEERLYIVGTINSGRASINKKSIEKKLSLPLNRALEKSSNFLDWILNVLLRDKAGEDLREVLEIEKPVQEDYYGELDKRGNINAYLIDSKDIGEKDRETIPIESWTKDKNPAVLEKMEEISSFSYPHMEETKSSIKTTVTEINKRAEGENDGNRLLLENEALNKKNEIYGLDFSPSFISKEKKFKANEIGNIYHFILSQLPLKGYGEEEISREVDRLVEGEFLTEEERGAISLDLLLDFYNSDFLKDLLKNSLEIHREESFTMVYDGALVDGQIDLWARLKDDSLLLLDFKSDRKINPENYKGQLDLYANALKLAEKESVREIYLYWIRHSSFSRIDLDLS